MSEKHIKEFDEDELVSMAGSGMSTKRDGAQAELTRRLIQALRESKESADKYSLGLVFLTIMLFIIGFAQLVFMSLAYPGPGWARVGGTIMVGLVIIIAGIQIFKEMFPKKL